MFWSWKTFLILYDMIDDLYSLHFIHKTCRTWEQYRIKRKLMKRLEDKKMMLIESKKS